MKLGFWPLSESRPGSTKELSKSKDIQREVLRLLSLDHDAISTKFREFRVEENGLEAITLNILSLMEESHDPALWLN